MVRSGRYSEGEVSAIRKPSFGIRVGLILTLLTFSAWPGQAAPVAGPNGHFYEVIPAPFIAWDDARAAAEGAALGCFDGHLATSTSLEEDTFLESLRVGVPTGQVWIGGFQPAGETRPTESWAWVNGEGPIAGVNGGPGFANWYAGEPNDFYGPASEQHLAIGFFGFQGWNDEGNIFGISGYIIEYEDLEAPVVSHSQGSNPSGKNTPTAGRNPKSGQNPDGFYRLAASDNCDGAPGIFVEDSVSGAVFGPFASGDVVKVVQAPGATPTMKPGPRGVVAQIHLNGDAILYAVDAAGNVSDQELLLVPPSPK
jgi:hypothetical protein